MPLAVLFFTFRRDLRSKGPTVRIARLSADSKKAMRLTVLSTHQADDREDGTLSRACLAGVALLLEAEQLAREVARSAWDFAVEISSLQHVGMTNSTLRWLVCKGLVEHGRETTPSGQTARSFHCFGGLRFSKDTCFVLTASGVEFARQAIAAEKGDRPARAAADEKQCNGTCRVSSVVPKWDRSRQQLRVGNFVVKQFKVPAANQERILAAFEEEGWPCRIDDPLPPHPEQDPKRRLHDTINSLNRNQKQSVLRFVGDGSGLGIRWELLEAGENGHLAVSVNGNGNGKAAGVPNLPL